MDVIWLAPAASLGLLALVVPVLIHLLTHQQTRHVPFPTLRFLRRTRLAAIRRRAIQNWFLLAVRVSILAMAVGALAAPVLVSEARQEEWRRRVARAVVVAPGAEADVEPLIESERRDSFVNAVFRPGARVADGLRDAALWLERQPPASHEVVVVGDLRADAIAPRDLTLVPARVGLRFLPLPVSVSNRDLDLQFQEGETMWRARTTLHDASTHVSYSRAVNLERFFTVRAAANEQATADAALTAVFARGIDIDHAATRRVAVVFEGGDARDLPVTVPPTEAWMRQALAALPQTTGGASGELLVVHAKRPGSVPAAAHLLEHIARVVFASDRTAFEPAPMPAQTLAEWSRPSGPFESGRPGDEGDRRWFWAAALVLMALEMIARRTNIAPSDAQDLQEPRVA